MTWSSFLTSFERNSLRHPPTFPASLDDVAPDLRAPLATCLARFQLAERGGRRISRQIDQVCLFSIDDDYRRALKLFVGEEARHADTLAEIITRLGGSVLAENRTHRLFVWGRNLAGIRCKLLVMNVAEVISVDCFSLVASSLPPGVTRRALEEIVADEDRHLAFHSAFFARRVGTSWVRATCLRVAWQLIGLAACAAVVLDHGAAMHALGISRSALWSRLTGTSA